MNILSGLMAADQQSRRIIALLEEVDKLRGLLANERAGRHADFLEHRRALEEARTEAYPVAGPPGFPTPASQEVASLKSALAGAHDRLAAAERRPVHGEKYAIRGTR